MPAAPARSRRRTISGHVADTMTRDTILRIAGRHLGRASRDLFAVTLEKALFSSPAA